MSKQIPTIGDTVVYHLTEEDQSSLRDHESVNNEQDTCSAIVVAAWGSNVVNLKVLVDGEHPGLWITSVEKGIDKRCWESPWDYEQRVGV